MIVGAGVVLAASYEAKAYGVRTAMGGAQARRLCPHAAVVPPRMSAYSDASKAVFAVFEDTTPLVEGLSIDEAFLDVRGLERIAGSRERDRGAAEAARARRGRSSDHRRRRADEVPREGRERRGEAERAAGRAARPGARVPAPAAVERLGASDTSRPRSCTAAASGRSATSPRSASRRSWRCSAARRDDTSTRSPRTETPGRSASAAGGARSARSALGTRPRPFSEIDATLVAIVDRLGRRLRAADRVCRTVVLRLRFADFSRATRSYTMPQPTAQTRAILDTARGLLAAATPMIRQEGLTLIGISLSNLTDATPFQLALPFDDRLDTALDEALDEVRDRFGSTAVTRAVLLGRDRGFDAAAARLTENLVPGTGHVLVPGTGHVRAGHRYSRPCSASQAFATRFCARVSHASATRSRSSSRSIRARSGSASAPPDSR